MLSFTGQYSVKIDGSGRLKFTPNILHEDKEFTPRAVYLSEKFIFSGLNVYYHLQSREGSITNTINSKRCFDLIRISDLLIKFTITHHLAKEELNVMYGKAFLCLTQSAILARNFDVSTSKVLYKEYYGRKWIAIKILLNSTFILRIIAFIFLFSPSFFGILFSLKSKIKLIVFKNY